MAFRHIQHMETFANCGSAMILSSNTVSGLTLDLHQAKIAQ
jgi:hypothetical protein